MWWEASLSLTCYPLQELIGKATVMHPSKHLPQASPILCSCTSVDGEMLALGLQSGTVVVWDVRTGEATRGWGALGTAVRGAVNVGGRSP